MTDLTFAQLSETNATRCSRWHPGFPKDEAWSGADWSNAMCGEAGELANVVKKVRRYETGTTPGPDDPPLDKLMEMMADETPSLHSSTVERPVLSGMVGGSSPSGGAGVLVRLVCSLGVNHLSTTRFPRMGHLRVGIPGGVEPCRDCERSEKLLDDVLWAVDHITRDRNIDQARAILLRARAHNADWHDARARSERRVVDLRDGSTAPVTPGAYCQR